MKKEYPAPPAAELLLFAVDPLCANENSPEPEEEGNGSWSNGRYEFDWVPLG